MNTLLSVIIPSYNRSKYLKDLIDSIIDLLDNSTEIIIVDDASTDNTYDVINCLKEKYNRICINYFCLEKNSGAQVARNRGLAIAKGQYILFVDSDDVPVFEGIRLLQKILLSDHSLSYAYGKVVMTDALLKPLAGGIPIGSAFEDSPVEMAGYHWHTMGALYRKSFLEKVGPWNPELTGSQDWEYQARVKMAGGKGLFVDTLVGYWRQHEGGRVGALKFRPDYVRSVVMACDVILSTAKNYQKCDILLEKRISNILFLHALEWGEYGYSSERANVLYAASNALSENSLFRFVILLFSYTPIFLDKYVRIILKVVNKIKKCKIS
jgi:glycosyltransferase involved in cell wall biosynthesis